MMRLCRYRSIRFGLNGSLLLVSLGLGAMGCQTPEETDGSASLCAESTHLPRLFDGVVVDSSKPGESGRETFAVFLRAPSAIDAVATDGPVVLDAIVRVAPDSATDDGAHDDETRVPEGSRCGRMVLSLDPEAAKIELGGSLLDETGGYSMGFALDVSMNALAGGISSSLGGAPSLSLSLVDDIFGTAIYQGTVGTTPTELVVQPLISNVLVAILMNWQGTSQPQTYGLGALSFALEERFAAAPATMRLFRQAFGAAMVSAAYHWHFQQ